MESEEMTSLEKMDAPQVNKLQSEILKLLSSLKEARESLEKFHVHATPSLVPQFNTDYVSSPTNTDTENVYKVNEEILSLTSNIETLASEMNILNNDLEERNTSIEMLECQIKDLNHNDTFESHKNQIASLDIINENTLLKQEIQQSQEKLSNISLQLGDKAKEIDILNTTITQLNGEISMLITVNEKKLSTLSMQHEDEIIYQLNNLTQLRKEVSSLKSVKEEIMTLQEEFKIKLDIVSQGNINKDHKINMLSNENNHLLENALCDANKLSKELQESKSNLIINEIISIIEHLDKLDAENQFLDTTKTLAEKYKSLENTCPKLREQEFTLISSLNELKTTQSDFTLQLENEKIKHEIIKKDESIRSLEEQLVKMNNKLYGIDNLMNLSGGKRAKSKTFNLQSELKLNSLDLHLHLKRQRLYDTHRNLSSSSEENPELMNIFIDKNNYNHLKEKYENLVEMNEELRIEHKKQATELRRLRHSLQENTIQKLLPHDQEEKKSISKLEDEVSELKYQLKSKQKEYEELEDKYKEMDDTFAMFHQSYNQLSSDDLLQETELENLRGEMRPRKEAPGTSQDRQEETRKKRQSLYDSHRGLFVTHTDADTSPIRDIVPVKPCIDCGNNQLNQYLSIYAAENEKLKMIVAEYEKYVIKLEPSLKKVIKDLSTLKDDL